jgi:signal transduction histidine kinase/FixJ family two-component response regulator
MKTEGKTFTRSIRHKIIIAFLVCVIALSAAWTINRLAFKQVLETVDKLSSPDDKLKAVNNIFYQIINLDQLQKIKASSNNSGSYNFIIKESRKLQRSLDSLKVLCSDNLVQEQLVDSVKNLLRERDKVLFSYLDVRKKLMNNKPLVAQMDSLNDLVTQADKDSIVLTTERKVLTTTLQGTNLAITIKEEDKRGFLGKIFKKKKKEKEVILPQAPAQTFVEEQVNTKVDTLVYAKADSNIHKAEVLIKSINKKQLTKNKKFAAKEAELAAIERTSVAQVMHILNEVEKEVIRQTSVNSGRAQAVVKQNAEHTALIMMTFFGVIAVLVVLVLTDISRSNLYREQLQKARDEAEFHSLARQRFLANMSHEIRTPLQSIIGFAEQAKQSKTVADESIDAIYRSSGHLLQVVNEVLDYSRITSGKFTFEAKTFNLPVLLYEVVQQLQPQAQNKSISLSLETNIDDHAFVSGDPFRLRQVLFNLLGNAIKFTEKGRVKMVVKGPSKDNDETYTFIVEDTGIGISPAKIKAVFNQFEQADSTITNLYGGTGLGLSIVKALVEQQQGHISVKSEPGVGSRFTVELKFPKAQAEALMIKPIDKKVCNGPEEKVWIVDDDNLILKLCSSILSKNNIDHCCFISAEDLLNEPWDDKVCLVLSDIRLPGMNGGELCRSLRKRVGSGLKIIALTAQALPEEREAILENGFDDLLPKPFREQDLIQLLAESRTTHLPSAEDTFSLAELEKMTYGDKEQMILIIEQFIEDSLTDLGLLDNAIGLEDTNKLVLLLHRVAGRTAQIGAKELGAAFRSLEITVDETNQFIELKKKVHNLKVSMEDLISTLTQYIAHWTEV